MTDIVDAATRSRMMQGIRSTDTKPEILVRKGLHSMGFRFNLRRSTLPGRPDLVLPRHSTAVFVHGCFWHAHKCQYFRIPSTNTGFWVSKIAANVVRDKRCVAELQRLGWRVLVIWECAIKGASPAGMAAIFKFARDWVVDYDAPYIEIAKGRTHEFSKRRSTSRAI